MDIGLFNLNQITKKISNTMDKDITTIFKKAEFTATKKQEYT